VSLGAYEPLITARVPRETLALADLSDVTGNTGSGTTVVMDDAPIIGPNGMVVNGTISGIGLMVRTGNMTIAGTIAASAFSSVSFKMDVGSPVAGQYIRSADGDGNFDWQWPDKIAVADIHSSATSGSGSVLALVGGPTFTGTVLGDALNFTGDVAGGSLSTAGNVTVGGTVDGVDVAARNVTAHTRSVGLEIPFPADDDAIGFKHVRQAITISKIVGKTDTGVVQFWIRWRDELAAKGTGTFVHPDPLEADDDGEFYDSGFDDATIPAGSVLEYVAFGLTGSPMWLQLWVEYTID
jgi:hypothetical protein